MMMLRDMMRFCVVMIVSWTLLVGCAIYPTDHGATKPPPPPPPPPNCKGYIKCPDVDPVKSDDEEFVDESAVLEDLVNAPLHFNFAKPRMMTTNGFWHGTPAYTYTDDLFYMSWNDNFTGFFVNFGLSVIDSYVFTQHPSTNEYYYWGFFPTKVSFREFIRDHGKVGQKEVFFRYKLTKRELYFNYAGLLADGRKYQIIIKLPDGATTGRVMFRYSGSSAFTPTENDDPFSGAIINPGVAGLTVNYADIDNAP